jgi:hypothetical protein
MTEVQFLARAKVFLFSVVFRLVLGATTRYFIPKSKGLGCKTDHSPPSSAKVRNGGAMPSFPHMPLWDSNYRIKYRDGFTFTCDTTPLHIYIAVCISLPFNSHL